MAKVHHKALFSFIPLVILVLSATEGYSQCSYSYKITSKTVSSAGIIEVEVKAKSNFSIELYSEKGVERKLVQTRSGSGSEKVLFSGLSTTGMIYRVAVVVPAEDNFLCRKKLSEEISFDTN